MKTLQRSVEGLGSVFCARKLTVSMLVFLFLLTPFATISAKTDDVAVPASDVEIVAPDSSLSDLETTEQANPVEADAEKTKDKEKIEDTDKVKDEKTEDSADTLDFSASSMEEEDPTIIPQSTDKQLLPDAEKSSGSLNYEYPIVVPPGRNGMQPDLKLTYNNQGIEEGSIFGAGWNLNIPYIERINRKGSDKLYTENYFNSSLSGELLLVSDNEWGAKIDNGEFLKYEFINNVWIVTDKEGTTYKFGSTGASRQDDPNDSTRIYKWMLEEIRDTNDNYISYEYFKDAGQIYPSRIVYTGNGTTDGIFEVNFLREIRNDISKSHKTAFPVVTSYRVYEIQTKVSNLWVRKYAMNYASADNGRRSVLNAIIETGKDESDNIITLPATDFDYITTSSGASWISDAVWNNYPVRFSECIISDVNGDGLADLMQSYRDGNGVEHENTYINNSDGTWTIDINYQPPVIFYQDVGLTNLRDKGVRAADINGDGLTDLIEANSFSNQTWLNNGNGWTLVSTWRSPLLFAHGNGGIDPGDSAQITDLNGDGLPDIFRSYTGIDLNYDVFINTGNGWARDTSLVMPVDVSHGVMISDINGDGLVDFLQAYSPGSGYTPIRTAFFNNGHGWNEDANWAPPSDIMFTSSSSSYDEGTRLMDYNADGLPDIIKALDNHGVYSTNYTNQGSGWILGNSIWNTSIPFGVAGSSRDTGARIVDINGDGMQDIIRSYLDGGIPDLYRSTNLNTKNQADFLSKIIYPKGGYADFIYKSTAEYKNGTTFLNADMPMIINVVDRINANDGLGNSFSTQYSYEGGEYYYANAFDRKFAGFAKVTATDDAGNKTVSYYHQGNETNSAKGEYDDHISKAGKIYRTETTDSSGNIYFQTINKWDKADLGNGRNFVKQIQKLDMIYDGDSSHKDSAELYIYDNTNGNLLEEKHLSQWDSVTASDDGTYIDNSSDDDITTTYSYVSNMDAHILGLPSEIVVTDHLGDALKADKYYYDGEDLGYATKGNQVSHEAWAWWEGGYMNEQKTYDGTYGLVVATKDFKDNWTNYAYDAYHLYPATITNSLNQTESYLYDYSCGEVKQKTDANNRIFQNVYDGLDRLLTEKQPDLTTPSTLVTKTAYVYTDTPLAISVQKTDYLSSTLTAKTYTYYDGLGRKIQERKQGETSYEVKDFAYNNLDLLQKESLPYFSTGTARTAATTTSALYINYSYDPMYRILATTDATGTISNYYNDWELVVTDKNGKAKELYKDALGRLIGVVEFISGTPYVTNYGYDGMNNLVQITDAMGNVRNFAYDPMGRRRMAEDLHSPEDETFGVWWYEYDENSNLFARYDANGQVVSYTYDALNRILTENYEGQAGIEVTYAYDAGLNGIGRLTSITTPEYTETRTYNALGLVASETKTIGATAYTTSYAYDRQGNQLTITNPDNSIIKYEYVNSGLLNKVSRKESTATSYTYVVSNFDYSPTEQITLVNYYNGMKTTNTYDANKLYRLSTKVTNIASNAKGQSLAYTYDNNGNITRIVDSSVTSSKKTVNYTYDDLNRLLSATATGVATGQTPYTENYTYDAIGNLTSKTGQGTYVYTGNQGDSFANPHAVTSIGSITLTYDQNGNLLTKGTALTNTWDYQNRLTQSISGAVTDTYTYDASGQRLSVSNGTNTTKYPSKFYNTDGTTPTKHIFANGLEIGTITGTGTTAIIHYTATDHLTGSNLTTNSSDIKEELLDYIPFGTIRIDEKSGTYSDQRKYAGSEYDSDTGLNYMNARYYDSNMGRFVSVDPLFLAVGDPSQVKAIAGKDLALFLADPQSLNSYAYARNNPLIYTDPDGKDAKALWNGLCNTAGNAWNYITTNYSYSLPPVGSSEYNQKMKEGLNNGGVYMGTNANGQDLYFAGGPGAIKSVGNVIKAGGSIAGLKVTTHAAEQFAERNMNIGQIENAFKNGTKYLDTRTGNLLHVIGERGKGGYTIVTDRAQKILVSTENFVTNLAPKNSPNRYKPLK